MWRSIVPRLSCGLLVLFPFGERLLEAQAPTPHVPFAFEAYLEGTSAVGGDNQGHGVAVSGNTVVVGAPLRNVGANAD